MHIEIQTRLRIRTNADLDGEILIVTRITVETKGEPGARASGRRTGTNDPPVARDPRIGKPEIRRA